MFCKARNEMDFIVFACADTTEEAMALAHLHPDIINPEPSELIGGGDGKVSDMGFVKKTINAITWKNIKNMILYIKY